MIELFEVLGAAASLAAGAGAVYGAQKWRKARKRGLASVWVHCPLDRPFGAIFDIEVPGRPLLRIDGLTHDEAAIALPGHSIAWDTVPYWLRAALEKDQTATVQWTSLQPYIR